MKNYLEKRIIHLKKVQKQADRRADNPMKKYVYRNEWKKLSNECDIRIHECELMIEFLNEVKR